MSGDPGDLIAAFGWPAGTVVLAVGIALVLGAAMRGGGHSAGSRENNEPRHGTGIEELERILREVDEVELQISRVRQQGEAMLEEALREARGDEAR